MNKEQKLVTLDTDYGFGIYLPNSTLKDRTNIRRCGNYAANKDNNPILFKNHEIAIYYAKISLWLNVRDFKINVIKFARKKHKITTIAKFEEMQEFGHGIYQYISDDIIYYIKEQYIDTVEKIQYFVFEDGDSVRSEKPYGPKRQKELFREIRQAATSAFYYTGDLDSVEMVSDDEIEIRFKNSTTKLHITTNAFIARYNMQRKEDQESSQFNRCLPFSKNMDKYLTFYTWVSKDNAEPDNFGFEGNIKDSVENVYNYMLQYLRETQSQDAKAAYSPVEFKGVILTKGDY